jgi:hypothetical protein
VEIHLHGVVNSISFEIMTPPAKDNQKTLKKTLRTLLVVERVGKKDSLFSLFGPISIAMLARNGLDKNQ